MRNDAITDGDSAVCDRDAVVARLQVNGHSLDVIPAPEQDTERLGIAHPTEHARFELCGRAFIVVTSGLTSDPHDASADSHTETEREGDAIASLLTCRELQVAILVAKGHPVKRVADLAGVTDWTVKEYLRRIYGKLGVRNQAAMVSRCAALLRRMDEEEERDRVVG